MLVLGVVLAAGPAGAATGGGECQLNGTAAFSPNGPGSTATFGYSFTGTLSSCKSNVSGAPSGGTIGAGEVLTEPVSITTSTGTVQGTAKYLEEPTPTGSGTVPVNSCPGGTTKGTALIEWAGGTDTVTSYTTQSGGPAVNLQGTVVANMVLSLVPGSENPAGTAPPSFMISSDNPTFPVGDSAEGALAFTTSSPQQCTASSGLSSVAIQGVVGVGSAS